MKTSLRAPGRRHDIFIEEGDYVVVRDFIYDTLRKEKEMMITDLLDKANHELQHKIEGDIGYTLLSVKQDMESKGMIKRVPKSSMQRFPMIGLKRRKRVA
jgi:hypothetical protein